MSFHPLFVCTQNPGVNYYRMVGFSSYMNGEFWPKEAMRAFCDWELVLGNSTELLYDLEKSVARADVVVWQRISTMRGLATIMGMKEKFKKKTLLEVDDNILNVDSSNQASASVAPGTQAYEMFKKQLKLSDGVIVSTESLKNDYKKYNKNIWVVPNGIDFQVWDKVKRKKHEGIVVGWQGGPHHREDLRLLMPVIPKVLKIFRGVKFAFYGILPEFLRMDGCYQVDVTGIENYPKTMGIMNPDLMLAPLEDTPLNRGRSNLRVLEAGAIYSGVVATASPKLPYAEIINKSGGGLLAKTTEEWVGGIGKFLENECARVQAGKDLNEYIRVNYDIKKICKQYTNLLKNL